MLDEEAAAGDGAREALVDVRNGGLRDRALDVDVDAVGDERAAAAEDCANTARYGGVERAAVDTRWVLLKVEMERRTVGVGAVNARAVG